LDLEHLATASGEWLRGAGPESDIVMSSRVRLARNVEGFPFLGRADVEQRRQLEAILRDAVTGALADAGEGDAGVLYMPLEDAADLDLRLLVERHLISRELADGEGARGVAFSRSEGTAVMVNEEDHLRAQVLRSGLELEACWVDLDRLDDAVAERVAYAFSPDLGYLTACPTNVGTGMRVSVMLHLPGLVWTEQIPKVFESIRRMGLAVRGLYGEGTQASGDFFQVSNQRTLGVSETEIIGSLGSVVPRILSYERRAREGLLEKSRRQVDDRVSRAYGMLRHARTISSEETLLFLSAVRLGVNLGLIDDLPISRVNELFILSQPAHLQKISGQVLEREARNAARAEFLRLRLNGRDSAGA